MTTSKKTAIRARGAKRTKATTIAKRGKSGGNKAATPTTGSSKPSKPTKSAHILRLLSRRNGATLAELMAATGWQAHSVRGFLSGTVRKRLNIPLTAHVVDGERRYRIDVGNSPKSAS